MKLVEWDWGQAATVVLAEMVGVKEVEPGGTAGEEKEGEKVVVVKVVGRVVERVAVRVVAAVRVAVKVAARVEVMADQVATVAAATVVPARGNL